MSIAKRKLDEALEANCIRDAFETLRKGADAPGYEAAFEYLYNEGFIEECGSCGCYHPTREEHSLGHGECRDDCDRFG